jgi:hypothetical protein
MEIRLRDWMAEHPSSRLPNSSVHSIFLGWSEQGSTDKEGKSPRGSANSRRSGLASNHGIGWETILWIVLSFNYVSEVRLANHPRFRQSLNFFGGETWFSNN